MIKKLFSADALWSLNNPLKGWSLHGLSEREARLMIQTLSMAEKSVIWIWQDGWAQWVHLSAPECHLLANPVPNPETNAPAEPPPLNTEEITAVKLATKKIRLWGREHERAAVGLSAEIIMAGQSHKTVTENVSEGGMKFAAALPIWVAGYFTVILTVPAVGVFELTCMLVEDQGDDKRRVAVVETEDEESHLPLYRAWVRQLV